MNDIYCEKTVKKLLSMHGFKFSKSLGQNFLIDESIPKKIVSSAGIDKTCGVLEVGPGIGALTVELSRAAGHVLAVELDRRLLPILRDTLVDAPNVEVVSGDILKLDIKKLINETMPDLRPYVCANLPYSITTPALTAFISAGVFDSINVMVQREVARRICAKPGSPDYSSFSVYASYHTEPKTLFSVPPDCFMPRPKVWSSVISMKPHGKRLLEYNMEGTFFSVVRAAFGQRRKTLINALCAAFGNTMSKMEIAQIVALCGLDPLTRGETLGIDDYARLAERIRNAQKCELT